MAGRRIPDLLNTERTLNRCGHKIKIDKLCNTNVKTCTDLIRPKWHGRKINHLPNTRHQFMFKSVLSNLLGSSWAFTDPWRSKHLCKMAIQHTRIIDVLMVHWCSVYFVCELNFKIIYVEVYTR